jgi:hypothetical protein
MLSVREVAAHVCVDVEDQRSPAVNHADNGHTEGDGQLDTGSPTPQGSGTVSPTPQGSGNVSQVALTDTGLPLGAPPGWLPGVVTITDKKNLNYVRPYSGPQRATDRPPYILSAFWRAFTAPEKKEYVDSYLFYCQVNSITPYAETAISPVTAAVHDIAEAPINPLRSPRNSEKATCPTGGDAAQKIAEKFAPEPFSKEKQGERAATAASDTASDTARIVATKKGGNAPPLPQGTGRPPRTSSLACLPVPQETNTERSKGSPGGPSCS